MTDTRRTYRVEVFGIPHKLLLTDAGAKRYGDSATLVETEGETTEEEEPEVEETEEITADEVEEEEVVEEKATTPPNKSRSTRNKRS